MLSIYLQKLTYKISSMLNEDVVSKAYVSKIPKFAFQSCYHAIQTNNRKYILCANIHSS